MNPSQATRYNEEEESFSNLLCEAKIILITTTKKERQCNEHRLLANMYCHMNVNAKVL